MTTKKRNSLELILWTKNCFPKPIGNSNLYIVDISNHVDDAVEWIVRYNPNFATEHTRVVALIPRQRESDLDISLENEAKLLSAGYILLEPPVGYKKARSFPKRVGMLEKYIQGLEKEAKLLMQEPPKPVLNYESSSDLISSKRKKELLDRMNRRLPPGVAYGDGEE